MASRVSQPWETSSRLSPPSRGERPGATSRYRHRFTPSQADDDVAGNTWLPYFYIVNYLWERARVPCDCSCYIRFLLRSIHPSVGKCCALFVPLLSSDSSPFPFHTFFSLPSSPTSLALLLHLNFRWRLIAALYPLRVLFF